MPRLHNTHCEKLEKVIMVFLFFLVLVLLSGFKESNNTQLVSLYDGWYRVEDGKRIDVKLPGFIPKDSSNNIVLYNDSLSAEDVNKVISFDEVTDGLSISVGDNILYKYQDTSFVRNKQMKGKLWADAVLPVEISDIPLCVTYENVKDSKMLISPPSYRFFTKNGKLSYAKFQSCIVYYTGNVLLIDYFISDLQLYETSWYTRKKIFRCCVIFMYM